MRAEKESEKVEYTEERMIGAFEAFLFKEEKSPATIGKYVRCQAFLSLSACGWRGNEKKSRTI